MHGLYQYVQLSFGVVSAPALFQQLMDTVLEGISHMICYIDDNLVTGTSDANHLQNLATVLEHLKKHGLPLKNENCFFLQDSFEYLGHKIDFKGLHTLLSRLEL